VKPEGSEEKPESSQAPKRRSGAVVAITLALLALVVWALNPHQPNLHPAPLVPPSSTCSSTRTDFVPSDLTSVPGISLDGLPPALKNQVLLRLNLEPCSCGCKLSLAECLATNPTCAVAHRAAEAILHDAIAPNAASKPDTPEPHQRR
jgi:hypothetical protein